MNPPSSHTTEHHKHIVVIIWTVFRGIWNYKYDVFDAQIAYFDVILGVH